MKFYIDKVDNVIKIKILDGNIDSLLGFDVYLDRINNGYIQDSIAYIPIDGDVNDIYNKITKLANRFNCEVILSDNVKTILSDAETEQAKFNEFSDKALKIRNNKIDREELLDFENVIKNKEFIRTLKPHQLLSAYHLSFAQNACNFSVPGSGKTTTVYASYEYLKNSSDKLKHVNYILVVGPLSSFISWVSEYIDCFGKEPKVLEIKGGISNSEIEKKLIKSFVDYDLILVSYGSLPGKCELLQRFLKFNKCMVVLDEAHRIKNINGGIQGQSALSLSFLAKSRVILTGTPAANDYTDLYNLFKFIWPDHNIIGYSITQLANIKKDNNDYRKIDLLNRISPFFIRIRKKDLCLPDPVYNPPYSCKLSNNHRIIYDAIAEMAIRKYKSSGISDIIKKSASIRLRQAATNPRLLEKSLNDYYDLETDDETINEKLDDSLDVEENILSLIHNFSKTEVPNKFIDALNLVKTIIEKNEKIIIWCEFVGTCEDLSTYLLNSGINNRLLYGKTEADTRKEIVKKFNDPKNDEFRVVIANPHAVGESISLHLGCHNALYFEQGFNAGVYMQSKDRIHRVGLTKEDTINYYYYQSENTVDSTVYNRVLDKEQKMLEIIEREEIPLIVNNLDYESEDENDIKAIIKDYYEYRNNIV